MIKVENLSLEIKKAQILKDISLELGSGKIHGLIGCNGSGKTMLMKCICGFVRPSAGRVEIDGVVIGKDADFPESLGVIIETPEFYPYLSGYENLKLLAGCMNVIGPEEIHQAMEHVGLDADNRLHVKKYSLGMRQRLGIAQAIMENPRLLVLDEPFNALDEDAVDKMRALFAQKREQGTTIILSSHDSRDIQLLCDTVYQLYKGEISEVESLAKST
ncbi:MAG: ATP-binding cassette domain-containing protein [Clostridiales bacterium]|nr:ATP-binding cassette domain-containing protein [Clostridiales bacterium]